MGKRRFTPEQQKAKAAARAKANRDKRRALKPRVPDEPIPDTQKKRGKPGPVGFVPTAEQRAQVEAMVGYGLTYEEIATLVINPATHTGISVVTLQKHFPRELEQGRAKAKALVIQSLHRKAVSADHPQAAICAMFIAKCQYGWRQQDKVVHEIEGAHAGVLVVPSSKTPEQWVAEQRSKNEKKKAPASG